MNNLSGPQRKFAEGIAAGLNQTSAYLSAYPKTSNANAAAACASRLLGNANVQAEIALLRAKADNLAGSAVLTNAEKRQKLATIMRAESPILSGMEVKVADQLRAIQIDNEMAGGGVSGTEEIQLIIRRMIRPGSPIGRVPVTTLNLLKT